MHDFFVAIGASSGSVAALALLAVIVRLWKTPKRLDRIEKALPVIAQGLLTVLQQHVTDGENGPISEAYKDLVSLAMKQMVSQKGGK